MQQEKKKSGANSGEASNFESQLSFTLIGGLGWRFGALGFS